MRLEFISNKAKINSLLQRIVALGANAEVFPLDVPFHDLGKHVSFLRVHRLVGDVPPEIAYKALEWAATLKDGTWAKIDTGSCYEAITKLVENPDIIVEAKGIEDGSQ